MDRGTGPSDVGPDAAKPPASLKDAFLSLVRAEKKFFYGTVVAQAHRIDVKGDQVVFTFTPTHRALRAQLEQHRPWLEGIAEKAAGRRMTVTTVEAAAAASAPDAGMPSAHEGSNPDDLRAKAMKTEGVQALLDVFGAEIKEIEEM